MNHQNCGPGNGIFAITARGLLLLVPEFDPHDRNNQGKGVQPLFGAFLEAGIIFFGKLVGEIQPRTLHNSHLQPEFRLQMPRTPLPLHATVLESSRRARATTENRPIHLLSNKERGLRAAAEVLKGALSPREAQEQFHINGDSLRYYKAKLEAIGMEGVAGVVAEAVSTPSAQSEVSAGSVVSTRVTAWDDYCSAYMYAGSRVPHIGKRKAAA